MVFLHNRANMPQLMLIFPEQDQEITITRKLVYCAHKTLGHHIPPAGKLTTQWKKLKHKAQHVAKSITHSGLSHHLALQIYQAVYLPAVTYVLPQSPVRPVNLMEDQKHSMQALFSACG